MNKIKVLFVCVHNSARSQMAEAYLKQVAGDIFDVESAGLEPGVLNPFIVRVMREDGIDISRNKTKSWRLSIRPCSWVVSNEYSCALWGRREEPSTDKLFL